MRTLARILGVDPGIRHTGWAIVDNGRLGRHGLLYTPGPGRLLVSEVLAFVLPLLSKVADRETASMAAIEEVVWRGMRRRVTMPLSHVAGAIAGMLVERGLDVYLLTPSMKAKELPKLRGNWSDHEQDAARLALRVWTVLNAPADSSRSKRSVDNEQDTFVARLVPGRV